MDASLHARDLETDRLELRDRLPEGLSVPRVGDGIVDAALRRSHRHRGDRDASLVEDRQEVRVAAAALAEQVLLRDPRVREAQRVRVRGVPADLVVGLLGDETRGARRHDDRRDLLLSVLPLARHRRDRDELRDVGTGVRDELLGTVDHPLGAVELRGRFGGTGVRTGIGFGEPETRERLTGGEVRQQRLLLLLGAEFEDRHHAESDTGLDRHRRRLVDPAELLEREGEGEVVATHAAIFLGDRKSEQAHLAHLRDDVVGEAMLAVVLRCLRRDDLVREVRNRFLQFGVVAF